MKCRFFYSPGYDFLFSGVDRLHPFDGAKFSKAWEAITNRYPDRVKASWVEPLEPLSEEVLLKIHTQDYLASLGSSKTVAQVVEIKTARFIPNSILQKRLITPIKLACTGTVLAAETALKEGAISMNFGGGFHHAFPDHGEGFCFFADAAIAIAECREKGLLSKNDKVLMIDLDAHRGNGSEAATENDPAIISFDMYNFQVYPGLHPGEPEEFPYMIPLKAGTNGDVYLEILRKELEAFLEQHNDAKLVFYNAGNDVLADDPLGRLSVSFEHVLERDRYVVEKLVSLAAPAVIMTSGGYTKRSYQIITELAASVINCTE